VALIANVCHLCATQASSLIEELREDKRRNDDSEGRERRSGLFMLFCVFMQQLPMRGCHFTFILLFVYFVIKITFNICWFKPPFSLINEHCYRKKMEMKIGGCK